MDGGQSLAASNLQVSSHSNVNSFFEWQEDIFILFLEKETTRKEENTWP